LQQFRRRAVDLLPAEERMMIDAGLIIRWSLTSNNRDGSCQATGTEEKMTTAARSRDVGSSAGSRGTTRECFQRVA